MHTESTEEIWKKMMSGHPYDATHPHLLKKLTDTRVLVAEYNAASPEDTPKLRNILDRILKSHGTNIQINQPFRCDYGCNISVGENFYANFNLTILDEAPVTIGDNVFIGPNVSIYTACHPTDPDERRKGTEWALPVTIGKDVWIGGNVTILAGITIGGGCTIGAGSVVTHDMPPRSVAAGNPCKVIKTV